MARLFNHLLIVIFLLVITFPLIGILTLPGSNIEENRALAVRPPYPRGMAALRAFPGQYTSYFNDHFGFRTELIHINFLLQYRLLDYNPSSLVVKGMNGWLFYTGDKSINDYRGITRFEPEQLRKWADSLEMKRVWLERQGIRYLFVVAPNKETIYGEHLPVSLAKIRQRTALDDLLDYLRHNTRVTIVDPRSALRQAKADHQLYYKTDTHWNEYGAFVAYRELMVPVSRWFPGMAAQEPTDFTLGQQPSNGGDLATMLGGSRFLPDEELRLQPRRPRQATRVALNVPGKEQFDMVQQRADLPRALVFRDSFMTNMLPFLSEHFSQTRYLSQRWNSRTPIGELVAKVKPALVIEEYVERQVKSDLAILKASDLQ
ncbi:MAG: hypothetical protein FIA91_04730 [Geobacter sp.]|nr:hypothetical protein [Geobacter sp.]